MSTDKMKELQGESFIDLLNAQYIDDDDNSKVDYWLPISKIILESVELRAKNEVSQVELAKRMKSRQSVISRFENMGRTPSYDFISRLSNALGHKPGITLYGEYMTVVPPELQSAVLKMANQVGMEPREYIQECLESIIQNKIDNYIDCSRNRFLLNLLPSVSVNEDDNGMSGITNYKELLKKSLPSYEDEIKKNSYVIRDSNCSISFCDNTNVERSIA